jgi:hypothetical protein
MAAFTGPADVSNHGQLWRDPGAAKVDHVHGSVNRNPLCGDKGPSLIVTAARCLMTDITLPAGRFAEGDFSIGRVFGRAWSVFSGNFATFVLVTATSGLPSFLIQQAAPDTLGNTYADVGMAVFATIVMLGFWTLSQASAVRRVSSHARPADRPCRGRPDWIAARPFYRRPCHRGAGSVLPGGVAVHSPGRDLVLGLVRGDPGVRRRAARRVSQHGAKR